MRSKIDVKMMLNKQNSETESCQANTYLISVHVLQKRCNCWSADTCASREQRKEEEEVLGWHNQRRGREKKKKCWDGTIREKAEKRRRSVGMVQSEKRQKKEEVLGWCNQRKGRDKKKKKCWDGAWCSQRKGREKMN